jgi:hypothetical protein
MLSTPRRRIVGFQVRMDDGSLVRRPLGPHGALIREVGHQRQRARREMFREFRTEYDTALVVSSLREELSHQARGGRPPPETLQGQAPTVAPPTTATQPDPKVETALPSREFGLCDRPEDFGLELMDEDGTFGTEMDYTL